MADKKPVQEDWAKHEVVQKHLFCQCSKFIHCSCAPLIFFDFWSDYVASQQKSMDALWQESHRFDPSWDHCDSWFCTSL